ncbi:MAG: L,D-transpeptidase, partial [Actinomycetes bacterium]
ALDAPRQPSPTPTVAPPGQTGDGAALPAVDAPANDPAEKNDSKITGAIVVLSSQKVVLFAGSRPVAEFPVSSGRNGLTPVGSFKVQSKSSRTVSNSDNTISMKWMTRFNGGIGFHGIPVRKDGTPLATPLGQRPVSAGCIRMKDDDARRIYDQLPVGGTVVVAR